MKFVGKCFSRIVHSRSSAALRPTEVSKIGITVENNIHHFMFAFFLKERKLAYLCCGGFKFYAHLIKKRNSNPVMARIRFLIFMRHSKRIIFTKVKHGFKS